MSSVNIVYPNARRVQLKIQPTTKIIEIIEEACKRQGLDPNVHSLHYQKRTLDISLTFRHTGVANNVTLDMQKLDTPRKFQDVTIVLQLSDGTKSTPKTFKPDVSSFEMILDAYKAESELLQTTLNSEKPDNYSFVTCSYLTEQIAGSYQLKHTTLKDMGLLNGRGLIRVGLTKFEKENFEKRNLEFEQKLEKKIKLDKIFQQKQLEESEKSKKLSETKIESKPVEASSIFNKQSSLGPVQSKEIIEILEKPVKKEFSSFKFPEKPEEIKRPKTQEITRVNEFADFKFPEETRGKVCNNMNELYEMELESKEACDRQAVLVNVDTFREETGESMDVDTEEDVFDLTLQDLKSMLGHLKKVQNEGDNLLMTKQMREQQQDLKAMKYPNVAIRICFHNRTFLQGIFRPKENISALYKFVEECIAHETNTKEDIDFHLYTSPPKKVIKDMNKTLFENQLCPAAQVYFKNISGRVPQIHSNARIVNATEAQEIVYSTIHQKMRQVNTEGLSWLHKEQAAANKILKTSSIANNILGQGRTRPTNTSQVSNRGGSDDSTKKKLGLFLGKKK